MTPIPAKIVDRLIKFAGMSDSAHDGEALNAIRKANALLKEGGWTWREVIQPKPVVTIFMSAISTARPTPTSWLAKIEIIKESWDYLTPWEQDFAQGVHDRILTGRQLSEKQRTVIDRLYAKCDG
ncbi:MAG: hypothetical protein HQK57_10145 [Deltaproteobacteria bacterium]|nr:hypothetical protein [Deltaproteobacteria bacterium]